MTPASGGKIHPLEPLMTGDEFSTVYAGAFERKSGDRMSCSEAPALLDVTEPAMRETQTLLDSR